MTAGNPLLVEQLADVIARGGALPEPGSAAMFEVDLLRARFAGGTPTELRFADAACLFGTAFRPSLAAELAELSSAEADAALEGLCASGVVRATTPGMAEFTHPLLRQTLYDRMAAPVRARKHAAAFRLLMNRGGDVAEVADHAMRGDLAGDQDAVAALEQAGRQAQAAGALASARERFEAAVRLAGSRASGRLLLQLAEALLGSADAAGSQRVCRRILAADDIAEGERMAARRLLGRALFVGGEPQAAQRELQGAVERSEAAAAIERVETLLEAVYISWPTGGPTLATPLALRARELARGLAGDLRLRAESAWGFCAFVGGNPEGVAVIEQAARAAEADPMSDIGAFAWTWGALGLHGNVVKWMERFDEAERAFTIGMAAAERLNLPVAIASLAVMHGDTCARTGRLQEGLRLLDRASALAELAPERAFWAAVAHSYILIEMGRGDEAQSWAQTARALADPAEHWPGWIWLWHVDAQLAHLAGHLDEECALFERIEELADLTGILEPCVIPWMGDAMAAYFGAKRYQDADRILQRLERSVEPLPCRIPRVVIKLAHATRLDLMQQPVDARRTYEDALALSREVAAPPLQARVLLRLGMHLRRRGETSAARKPFADALELAEAVGAEPLMARASGELERVGGRRRRRFEDPDALTAAEARVASLAAEGLPGRDITIRLNVTINTVETHLQHVYRKLNIRSQRELMRLATSGKLLPAGGARGSVVAAEGMPAAAAAATAQSSTPAK
jgi:DNA-binding CsgD family transcriptional regulator